MDTLDDMDELVNVYEAVARAGVSYRQVDHWTRRGYLIPAGPADGSGSCRRFSSADIAVLTFLGRLRRLGVNLGLVPDALIRRVLASGPCTVMVAPDGQVWTSASTPPLGVDIFAVISTRDIVGLIRPDEDAVVASMI